MDVHGRVRSKTAFGCLLWGCSRVYLPGTNQLPAAHVRDHHDQCSLFHILPYFTKFYFIEYFTYIWPRISYDILWVSYNSLGSRKSGGSNPTSPSWSRRLHPRLLDPRLPDTADLESVAIPRPLNLGHGIWSFQRAVKGCKSWTWYNIINIYIYIYTI